MLDMKGSMKMRKPDACSYSANSIILVELNPSKQEALVRKKPPADAGAVTGPCRTVHKRKRRPKGAEELVVLPILPTEEA
ncbi:hypothetical protein [Mesorhizobium sp. LSJC264A00]|uniref:hypothetical protein n=1 Tax=unclassified Mesorhizobium TaxID=325217 RepID=UPI0012EC31B6|nr:hypothetical protein [Mesorhizobium sp. LSJC264A00]